jgi:hypothetical protein
MRNVQPSKSIAAKVHKPYRFEFTNIIMHEEGTMSPKKIQKSRDVNLDRMTFRNVEREIYEVNAYMSVNSLQLGSYFSNAKFSRAVGAATIRF